MTLLVQDWFRVWEDRPGTWIIEEPLHSEHVKSYLISGTDNAVLIDSGMGVGDIRSVVEDLTALPIQVIQSHAHAGHIGGAWQFDDVAIHPAEANVLAAGVPAEELARWFDERALNGPLPTGFNPDGFAIPGKPPTRLLSDGEVVDLGGRSLEVLFAPGHSAGGVVLLDRRDRSLFSTDIVYLRSLYVLNPDSSVEDYVRTLERLSGLLPDLDRLYPSHGPTPLRPQIIQPMLAGMREVLAGRPSDGLANAEFGLDEAGEERIHRFEFAGFRILVEEANLPASS